MGHKAMSHKSSNIQVLSGGVGDSASGRVLFAGSDYGTATCAKEVTSNRSVFYDATCTLVGKLLKYSIRELGKVSGG